MSQYSEMMGSFIRTGNYPMEANYIFDTEQDLFDFYKDPINRTTLHTGLFRIVCNDDVTEQAIYWAVPDDEGYLYFTKLIDFSTISNIAELKEKLEQEISDRILGDKAIWGTEDITSIDINLNSILKLSEAILNIREDLEEKDQKIQSLKDELKATVGTEEDDIITYLQTLDYKSLTDLSQVLNKFLNTIDEEDPTINTFKELQEFLRGFEHTHNLYECFVDFWNNIQGNPTPNTQFRTLRGIQDFIEALASTNKHRMDNIQTELDQTQVGIGLSGDGSYNADQETYHLKNATSVMNALKILDALINEAINNCNIVAKDTNTTTIDIIKEKDKTTISAYVRLSSDPNNDITEKDDGLYHRIDSEYEDGILTIKVNGNVRQQHVLGLSSVVDKAYYDSDQESIIIIFKLQNGETQTVTIPAASIIAEWEVDNTYANKVVELTKDRVVSGGADKLSADVRISNNKDNILEKDGNTLLVRGTADNITLGSKTLKEVIEEQTESIEDVKKSVSDTNIAVSDVNTRLTLTEESLKTEIQDRKDEITRLDQKLDDEITNRTLATTDLNNSLSQEIADRIKGDSDIKNLITESNAEISNVKTDLSTLNQSLNTEIQDRKDAVQNLRDDFERETDKLSGRLDTVTTNLNSVTADLTALEQQVNLNTSEISSHKEKLSSIEIKNVEQDTALETLETKLETVKSNIENNISTQISSLQDSLNQEITRSTQEDSNIKDKVATITTNLQTEVVRATNAESLLDEKISSLKSSLDNNFNNDSVVKEAVEKLKDQDIALGNKIDLETERATNAEALLDNKINTVKNNVETNIGTQIASLQTALNQEIDRSTKEDIDFKTKVQDLATSISNESTRAQAEESVIRTEMQTKVDTLQNNQNTLKEQITTLETNTNTELAKKINSIELLNPNELVYTIMVDGQSIGSINIPKDQFLKNVDLINDSTLRFVFDTLEGVIVTDIDLSPILVDALAKINSDIIGINDRIDQILLDVQTEVNKALNSVQEQNKLLEVEITRAIQREDYIETRLTDHIRDHNNPHMVTADQVGAYTKDKINELLEEINSNSSTSTDTIKESISEIKQDLSDHIHDYDNPHKITKAQVGLDKVDNTSDIEKPISLAVQEALNNININISDKASQKDLMDHVLDHTNPHMVTKEQIGLGNVDNTSDLNKPISLATQMALDKKANVNHSHTMADITDLENLPITKGVINNLGELPENAAGGDKYILTSQVGEGNTRYTLLEYDGGNGTWKQKLLTTGGIATIIDGDVWKLNSSGLERVLDVSDYSYFYNKMYDETKDLIEDIDWEENDVNDTNQQIRLKITYKTSYGDPNESEVTNPFVQKQVKYIDIEKARFLSNAYSRPATQEDVNNGYATTVGEPLLILILTTGDHVTISLKEALNIYEPIDTASIDMSVTDWTGTPEDSYKVSATVKLASVQDKDSAVSLHINNGSEQGLYANLNTSNTNSIKLNPSTGANGTQKTLSADLIINNSLNNNSDVLLTVDDGGLSAKLIWGDYE